MFFITPNHSVAFNAKVASSTLARAIISAYYPDREATIANAAYPEGRGPDNTQFQFLVPIEQEATRPVVLVAREPVSRFRSAMAQLNIQDVDAALVALETGAEWQFPRRSRALASDIHLRPQVDLIPNGGMVFRLEDLDAAATHLGLTLPLPSINEARREKPELTESQVQRALAYYAKDRELYDRTPIGGAWCDPNETPEPVPASITATQIRLWLVRNGVSMDQVSAAIASIPEPQSRAEAEVLWEYAPYVERSNPLVAMIANGFGMDEAAIDNAFREASLF